MTKSRAEQSRDTKQKHTNTPLKMNSKKVFKFSGEGLVTKMLLRPKCTAAATDNPRAADFPRPRPAVTESSPLPPFSVITSIIFRRALACVVGCYLLKDIHINVGGVCVMNNTQINIWYIKPQEKDKLEYKNTAYLT